MTASPLVTAYLADLDRALAGADPADRLEIVDAVREHIDAAVAELGASPSQAQIAGVLRRLGTADDVAAAWAVGAERPVVPAPPARGYEYQGPGYPPAAPTTRAPLPGWAVALFVVLGVLLAGPLLVAVLVAPFLFSVRASGAVGGAWGAWALPVLLVAATVAAGVAWRRSVRHRGGWLVTFVVLLVVDLGALAVGLGLATVRSGGHVEEVGVPVEVVPTPSPLSPAERP